MIHQYVFNMQDLIPLVVMAEMQKRYESTFSAGIYPQCWLYSANLIFDKEKSIRAIDKSSPDIIVPDKSVWANNVIRTHKEKSDLHMDIHALLWLDHIVDKEKASDLKRITPWW